MSRRGNRTRAALALGLAALLVPTGAAAYHVLHVSDDLLARAWPVRRMPVPFRLDRGIPENDPDLIELVRDGAAVWNGLTNSYAGTEEVAWTAVPTSLASVMGGTSLALGDGIPEIAVDFQGDVMEFLGLDLDVVTGIGVTEVSADGVITDGFILMNGTLPLGQAGDLTREILAHETGHLLGFGHSGITDRFVAEKGMEFPTMSGSTDTPILSADDVAVASALYPDCGFEAAYGAIAGEVRRLDTTGTMGVSVTAISSDGTVVAGHVTGTFDLLGGYHIGGLPPGVYDVYIEPLDGTRNGAGREAARVDVLFLTTPDIAFEPEQFPDMPPGSGSGVTVEAGRTTTGVSFRLGLGGGPPTMVSMVDGTEPPIPLGLQSNVLPLGGGPLATIDVAETIVLVGTAVAFDGSASRSCDGAITGWSWSFDDGSPVDTGMSPAHTFTNVREYDVVLTVTDASGAMGSHFLRMEVVEVLPPDPDIPKGCGCRVGGGQEAHTRAWVLATLMISLALFRRFVSRGRR